MKSRAEKEIIEYKKDLFRKEVVKAAILLKVPVPIVKFWEHFEDHFKKGERAHIHTTENIICIAEPELEIMTEEEIRTTASHEVAHLHHIDHGPEFWIKQGMAEQGMFEIPPGNVGALPEDYEKPKRKKIIEKTTEEDKSKCTVCSQKALKKPCEYCGGFYCKKHSKPIEPDFSGYSSLNEKAHPCFAYSHYLEKKAQKEKEEYEKALEKMFGKKRKN